LGLQIHPSSFPENTKGRAGLRVSTRRAPGFRWSHCLKPRAKTQPQVAALVEQHCINIGWWRRFILAVNRQQFTEQLHNFYDFTDKVVLFVGAGGGRLFNPAARTRKLIAIDRDSERLQTPNTSSHSSARDWEITVSSFESVAVPGDVVYFEFCLHEMPEPYQALVHARTLAPDVVVFDHLSGSEWSFYAAEEDQVRRSTEVIERFGIRRREKFCTEQRFASYPELRGKLAQQGAAAMERVRHFDGVSEIVIPMSYQLVLL
jgi:hypothetical protein